MTGTITAFTGAAVFDGDVLRTDHALLVRAGRIERIVPHHDQPQGGDVVRLDGGILMPGFVDLQVNGGGGVMLNAAPTLATLERMAKAHEQLGAMSILPTLISDTYEVTRAAIDAVGLAVQQGVTGIAGLHLEGPHLARARKGAHDAGLIRPMTGRDLDMLCKAAQDLPVLKITLAPENVRTDQMRALVEAGAILSLGHTDATYDQCVDAAEAGVVCVTHLFNAMRPLGSREPGVVGAALALGALSAGMIGDLVHVHGETMRLALAAKQGPGRIFLVSDAMAVAATDARQFTLNDRVITRKDGRLTLGDGTLAGADLDLATALRNLYGTGVALSEVLAMVTSRPADLIGQGRVMGHLRKGAGADLVHLDDTLHLNAAWRAGLSVKIV